MGNLFPFEVTWIFFRACRVNRTTKQQSLRDVARHPQALFA